MLSSWAGSILPPFSTLSITLSTTPGPVLLPRISATAGRSVTVSAGEIPVNSTEIQRPINTVRKEMFWSPWFIYVRTLRYVFSQCKATHRFNRSRRDATVLQWFSEGGISSARRVPGLLFHIFCAVLTIFCSQETSRFFAPLRAAAQRVRAVFLAHPITFFPFRGGFGNPRECFLAASSAIFCFVS